MHVFPKLRAARDGSCRFTLVIRSFPRFGFLRFNRELSGLGKDR